MAEQQPVSADGTLEPHKGQRKRSKKENPQVRKRRCKGRVPPTAYKKKN